LKALNKGLKGGEEFSLWLICQSSPSLLLVRCVFAVGYIYFLRNR